MFNYSNTCPSIDREIELAKSHIKDFIEEIIAELSPFMCDRSKLMRDFVEQYTDSLYEDLEDCFELVRTTNSDMRSEAEKQMQDLQDELENAKEELATAVNDIETAKNETEEVRVELFNAQHHP